MAELCSSVFAKHSGNILSPIFFCNILLVLVSSLAAMDICTQYDKIVLKPTYTYSHCDVKIPVKFAEQAPTVAYPNIKSITSVNLTTIVMLSPKGLNSVHWLRTNISKNLLEVGTSKRSNDALPYKEPNPPEGAGMYTYQFYLLSQPRSNVSIDPFIDRYRKNFRMAEFQKANMMEVLGAFQFRAEYEENGSGQPSFSVILGIISVFLAVFFGP